MEGEWPYSDQKFSFELRAQADEDLRQHPDFRQGSRWFDFIQQYLHRAGLFGLDNPLGRQALMKALNTVWPACESMARVYGTPPAPGVNSGELRLWTPPL
jgi:hypothetical protein